MKTIICIIVALLMQGRPDDFLRCIQILTGAIEEEQLDDQVMDRFESLASRPLRINVASRHEMISSGLLSNYQIASLLDYRKSHGDVLSISELALLDGFGEDYARALRPFISLYSPRLPGELVDTTKDNSVILRGGLKDSLYMFGGKYRIEIGDRLGIGVTARRVYSGNSSYGFYAALHGVKRPYNLILGDFNARFGQGLALWSGFTMTGVPAPLAFCKRPSGLSPSWSYTSSNYRGVAGDIAFGRVVVSSFTAMPGLRPWMESGKPLDLTFLQGVNVACLGRYGQASITGVVKTQKDSIIMAKVAIDGRYSFRGIDFYGECAVDLMSMCLAAVGGTTLSLGNWRFALAGRYYPASYNPDEASSMRTWSKVQEEIGASAAVQRKNMIFSIDAATKRYSSKRQMKLCLVDSWTFGDFTIKMKLAERLRDYEPKNRSEGRIDCCWQRGNILLNTRIDASRCIGTGILGYIEPGWKDDRKFLYFRGTIFKVDNWEDRIWCYERDAPGSFNIPAYAGRGYSLSLYGGVKMNIHWTRLKAYIRGSLVRYPWLTPNQQTKKLGKSELNLQIMYDF